MFSEKRQNFVSFDCRLTANVDYYSSTTYTHSSMLSEWFVPVPIRSILTLTAPLYCKLTPEKQHDLIMRHSSTELDFEFELTLTKRVDLDLDEDNSDEDPESMRGRPNLAAKYKTNSTRIINAWWHYWHGRPLTSSTVDLNTTHHLHSFQ